MSDGAWCSEAVLVAARRDQARDFPVERMKYSSGPLALRLAELVLNVIHAIGADVFAMLGVKSTQQRADGWRLASQRDALSDEVRTTCAEMENVLMKMIVASMVVLFALSLFRCVGSGDSRAYCMYPRRRPCHPGCGDNGCSMGCTPCEKWKCKDGWEGDNCDRAVKLPDKPQSK